MDTWRRKHKADVLEKINPLFQLPWCAHKINTARNAEPCVSPAEHVSTNLEWPQDLGICYLSHQHNLYIPVRMPMPMLKAWLWSS